MALLFCDGFGHTADVSTKWDSLYGSGYMLYGEDFGYDGDWGTKMYGSSSWIHKTLPSNYASLATGVRLKIPSRAYAYRVISFYDNTSTQCELRPMTDGSLALYRGTTFLTSTMADVIPVDEWFYLDIAITLSNTIGAITVRIKTAAMSAMTIILDVSGFDNCSTSNEYANAIRLYSNNGASTLAVYFDDFYVCDTSGTVNNAPLGEVRIYNGYPSADGANLDFTPSSGTAHFSLVDDPQYEAETDMVESGTVGHKDSYSISGIPVVAKIFGIQINATARNVDFGSITGRTLCISGATTSEGADFSLDPTMKTAITVHELDPDDSASWTNAKITAAEFGVKVQA